MKFRAAAADPAAQQNFEQLQGLLPSPATALPSLPGDGQELYYEAASGVSWHLRYRGSSLKWEYLGGPPLFAEVTTLETTGSLAYVALATVGPSITVPLLGTYDVEIGVRAFHDSANQSAVMSYDIGGTAAVNLDSVAFQLGTGVSAGNIARVRRKVALPAATALVSKYKSTGGVTASFESRWMRVTPMTIG